MVKFLFYCSLFVLLSCTSRAPVDLAKLSASQWEEDFNYFRKLQNDSFAGFTPEIRKKFNDESEATLQRIKKLSHIKILMEFSKMAALLEEAHTEFDLTNPKTGFKRFPLTLCYFDTYLYIISAGDSNKIMPGKRLIKIDGVSVDTVLEKLKPYISHDNDLGLLYTGPELMVIPEVLFSLDIIKKTDEALFEISDDSGTVSLQKVKSIDYKEYENMNKIMAYNHIPYYLNNPEKYYWYSYLEKENTCYLNINKLLNQKGEKSLKQTITEFFKDVDIKKPDNIVIDFRNCQTGHYEFGQPLLEEIKKRPEINQRGKLFIVTGRTTFAASLVTSVFLKTETNALLIGEPARTKPNYADNINRETMPNSKLYFTCTNRIKVHAENTGWSDYLPVDIYINPSFEKYRSGKDEVLEKIISIKGPVPGEKINQP